MLKKVAIVGLGWLGESLGVDLNNKGFLVSGSTTSFEKLTILAKHPFYVGKIAVNSTEIVGDWESFIFETDYLIINIPPKRIEAIETIYPEQIRQIATRTPKNVKIIFVSSTAVYGATNEIVTELTEVSPEKPSGWAVLNAEKILQSEFGKNVTIVRLAGLIGEDRNPGRFLAGKKVQNNPNSKVNLIHKEDCIGLITSIIEKDCFGEIFNGCATIHPNRADFYIKAAQMLQLEVPIFENSTAESGGKIIDNTKSKNILNYQYQFDNPEDVFNRNNGKISIVGGGPGDKGLLTIRAFNLIQEAAVLLYDNLISDEILAINSTAEKVYVGRKYGDIANQKDRQDAINKLFIKYYALGKKVVRIKSGDSFIYGRGGEEARFLRLNNIDFEMVPGITAAMAAANSFSIPVTERQKSNAVLICTAHTADYSFDQLQGIAEILKAGNTLMLYMGLKSLDKIIPKLIEVTGNPSIPINAISNVSRKDEVLITSTLGGIEAEIEKNPLKMPVVFIVGVQPIQKN
ncbi:MAG: uroporphyrinogen-III C-methyltransferase [Lutibacter sp.]|nr:uroporphyrinogen-III C-methyltransferase [Lutibacter sp.]